MQLGLTAFCEDILKFHYMAMLLVDSNCLLLVLKMFGLQEPLQVVGVYNEVPDAGFVWKSGPDNPTLICSDSSRCTTRSCASKEVARSMSQNPSPATNLRQSRGVTSFKSSILHRFCKSSAKASHIDVCCSASTRAQYVVGIKLIETYSMMVGHIETFAEDYTSIATATNLEGYQESSSIFGSQMATV